MKLITEYGKNEETEFNANSEVDFFYHIINTSDEKLENIRLEVKLPEGTSLNDNYKEDSKNYKYISSSKDSIILEIPSLEARQEEKILVFIDVGEIDKIKLEQSYAFSIKGTVNNTDYYSNEIIKTAKQDRLDLSVKQESNYYGEYIQELQEIQFTTTIKNNSSMSNLIRIEDEIQKPLVVLDAYIDIRK